MIWDGSDLGWKLPSWKVRREAEAKVRLQVSSGAEKIRQVSFVGVLGDSSWQGWHLRTVGLSSSPLHRVTCLLPSAVL